MANESVSAGAEQDDDRDTYERDRESDGTAEAPALEPEADGEHQRQRGGEGDDERGGPGGRVLRAHVQGDVVADDHADADRGQPQRIAPRQAGQPANSPEEEANPGAATR